MDTLHHQERPPHIPALDGVRGFAALLVLWCHFPYIRDVAPSRFLCDLASFGQVGYFGVDLFFVLSGFLITRILLTEKRSGRIRIGRFFLRRTLRIFPIYYLTIGFCAIWFGSRCHDLIAAAFYSTNIYHLFATDRTVTAVGHTWSLAVEEQFYLVWPFLLASVALPRVRVTLCRVLPVVAVATFFLLEYGFGKYSLGQMPVRMLSLALGASLAVREKEVRSWNGNWIAGGLVATILVLFVNQRLSKYGVLAGRELRFVQFLGYSVASYFVMALVIGAKGRVAGRVRSAFAWRPLRAVGSFSYGLYLYHVVILNVLGLEYLAWIEEGTSAARWFLALGLCFLVPILSYRYIETPILAFRQQLEHPRIAKAVPLSSQGPKEALRLH